MPEPGNALYKNIDRRQRLKDQKREAQEQKKNLAVLMKQTQEQNKRKNELIGNGLLKFMQKLEACEAGGQWLEPYDQKALNQAMDKNYGKKLVKTPVPLIVPINEASCCMN